MNEKNAKAQSAIKSPSATARTLHGQSAMEFLMTYGWALLIVLAVISVFFYLGVFSPQKHMPKSCVLPAGFSCYEFMLDGDGKLNLDLGQSTGKTIYVTGVACALNSSGSFTVMNITIQNGQHAVVTGSGIQCQGVTSEQYRGKVILSYQSQGSSITHTAEGDISGPLEGTT